MIGFTLFNIVTNILIVFVCTIKDVIQKIKESKWCKKRDEDRVLPIKRLARAEMVSFENLEQLIFK